MFERANVETIVINAAGCGSSLKEYGYLLRDDSLWADRARAFSAKVRDISEILVELEPRATYHPLPYLVAYHDACHLRHAQGVYAQPRSVLSRIPGLRSPRLLSPSCAAGARASTTWCSPNRDASSATAKQPILAPPGASRRNEQSRLSASDQQLAGSVRPFTSRSAPYRASRRIDPRHRPKSARGRSSACLVRPMVQQSRIP